MMASSFAISTIEPEECFSKPLSASIGVLIDRVSEWIESGGVNIGILTYFETQNGKHGIRISMIHGENHE
jgi:hypothetical protein